MRGGQDGAPGSLPRILREAGKLTRPRPPPFFISPSKGNTRNIKKLEERKTDPLSLEGYVSSTPLPKPPEKGRGGCLCGAAPSWLSPSEQARPGRAHLSEESPCELACVPEHPHSIPLSSFGDDTAPSSTSESSALSKTRFALPGLAALTGQKGKRRLPQTHAHAPVARFSFAW